MGPMGGRPMGGMRGPMGMGRPGPYDRGDRYGPIGGPMGRYGGPGGYGNVKGPGGMYGYGGYGGGLKFQSFFSLHYLRMNWVVLNLKRGHTDCLILYRNLYQIFQMLLFS